MAYYETSIKSIKRRDNKNLASFLLENIDYLFEPRFWKTEKNSLFDYDQEKKIVIKNGIKEESNKQSTQENEDEDMRDEHLHNISSSESNITPLNSLGNNENSENEMHSDKIQIKKEKNENNELNDKKIQNKFNLNEQGLNDIIKNNNADYYNIISPNILMDDSNFANTINFKNPLL